MANILIVGRGGYGDMFPMFAIARELGKRGHKVRIAAEKHHLDSLLHTGIELIPTDTGTAGSFWRKAGLEALVQSDIESEYGIILEPAKEADIIIGNQLAYSGSIASRVLGKPWVFCAPSPLAIPSPAKPPVFPYLGWLQNLSGKHGLPKDACLALVKGFSRLAMSSNIRLQRRLGIFDGRNPRFEGMYSDSLNLILASRLMVPALPDWPANTVVTGHTWFDPEHFRDEIKIARLRNFLSSGPPPIVFAPGGGLRKNPLAFVRESLRACTLLKTRGIIVAADRFHAGIPVSDQVLVTGYVPYAELLKGARAFVHSGGIGALGWGAKFGIPSLAVPREWDQFDNALRAQRLGIGCILKASDCHGEKIADAVSNMVDNQSMKMRLREVAPEISQERGEETACDEIEKLLGANRLA